MTSLPPLQSEAVPPSCGQCGLGHSRHIKCKNAVVADRYLLVRKLGEGGMGRVFEVRHLHLRRRLAMKLLHPHWASDAYVISRFQHEAIAAAALENEYIAAATDFGFSEQHGHYLVLEYVDGTTLRDIIDRKGAMPAARALRLFEQVCHGLGCAHAAGIVHRDIKPDNLSVVQRVNGNEQVKILDFGIAKLASSTQRTAAGTRMGTLYYMPPEQISGEVDLDARADVYSVGVSLFEALSTGLPHPGTTEPEVLLHIVARPPVSLLMLRPELPTALCEVVHRAIMPNPSDRFQTILELGVALQQFAGSVSGPQVPGSDAKALIPAPRTFTATAAAPPKWTNLVAAPKLAGPRTDSLTTSTHPISRSIPVPLPRRQLKRSIALLTILLVSAALLFGVLRSPPTTSHSDLATSSSAWNQSSPSIAAALVSPQPSIDAAAKPSTQVVLSGSQSPQGSAVPTVASAASNAVRAGARQPAQQRPQPLPNAPKARPGQYGAVFFDE